MPGKKNRRSSRPKQDTELKAIYDELRRQFTAADLQQYTVIEPMVPARQVLAEMKQIHEKYRVKGKRHGSTRGKRKTV